MARRRKPEGETIEQAAIRRQLETVADCATRSEKVSWDRKMDNMVALLDELRPIEDEILEAMNKKTPIIDKVSALRQEMVRECVHPYTHLVYDGETTRCKFCDKSFGLVRHDTSTD